MIKSLCLVFSSFLTRARSFSFIFFGVREFFHPFKIHLKGGSNPPTRCRFEDEKLSERDEKSCCLRRLISLRERYIWRSESIYHVCFRIHEITLALIFINISDFISLS